jgi:5'-methylthioadenosine phosphorylase
MKAILGGTGLIGSSLFKGWPASHVSTPYGTVTVQSRLDWLFLQRHGDPPRPPHRIEHRANIHALKEYGVREVIAICSVGSLRSSIIPGTLVIPDDFIAPWTIPTFFDEEMQFTVPELDATLGEHLFSLAKGLDLTVRKGGIYVQTRGPRLETKAEITMLKRFGHIVGMTMASEATLCMECSISYVAVCSVDNFCNGVTPQALTMAEIQRNATFNRAAIERVLQAKLYETGT